MTMMVDAPLILFIGRSPQALGMPTLLAACGYRIEVAREGGAAILAAMTSAPHAVVVEVGLAHLDGFRIAQTLRTIPDLCDVPLLAFGCGDDPAYADCIARVFDGQLPLSACGEELRLSIDASLSQLPPPSARRPRIARLPARMGRRQAA